jgi:hypothetical protein
VTYVSGLSKLKDHLTDRKVGLKGKPPRLEAHDKGLWRSSSSAGEPLEGQARRGPTSMIDDDQSRGSRFVKLKASGGTDDGIIVPDARSTGPGRRVPSQKSTGSNVEEFRSFVEHSATPSR